MDRCVKLAVRGKQIADKSFEGKASFQAYCKEIGNAGRALNINLIDYNGGEPIKISDILQQEKDIGELNIYCNKNHDIYACREGKKRYYEFKEEAHYQMTSTWPVKNEFGEVISLCTMVMNVSDSGITKILKFSGKDYTLLSEEDKKLIKQNEELHIQGLSLYKAV
ncbi:hypothetical protein [Wolbachia pipientis]|uniref:hypothetical protein n=1 Tax=Wolbachia pipientis TaxID=955 RepID=UPI0025A38A2D|nr:hypothetical protein [Wolbachia pipientis]MDM8335611.1 hypothetical protein [Wolbachia pipientis]